MMAEGVVLTTFAGEHSTANFGREPLLCRSHFFLGKGHVFCVLVLCDGGLCEGDFLC